MSPRPVPAEWSGEEYGLPFPDGTPLMLRGQLQAGSRDASLRPQWGSSPALHVVVACGGYPAAACDQRILIDATVVIKAAEARPAGRCCTECGHGGRLRAWAHVNIHGDLAPDGNIEWPDHEDDAFWPVIEESVTCKVHGEDFIEKLVDGQYTSYIDTATGRYAAAPAASAGGGR